MLNAVFCL
jgi:chromosome segregation ATPase